MRFCAALVESEGWISVGHQACVGDHAGDPAVEAEHEVEQSRWVAVRKQERHGSDQDEQRDQAGAATPPPTFPAAAVPLSSPGKPASSEEDSKDQVVRDREQPPLHEHEPTRELAGIGEGERGGAGGGGGGGAEA